MEMLSKHLSILHLNIQSLLPKIDLIRSESDAYDIMVFSDSWLKSDIPDNDIQLESFLPPFRSVRCDRLEGGVVIYVRDTYLYRRRADLEIRDLEAVWMEVTARAKRELIGGFYRPPNSSADYFHLISESIDRALNTNINDIISVGDFNYNRLSNENNRIKDLMQLYGLKQLKKEATHYTEHSASLIDLIMVRNESNILTSGVADPFISDQIRYHCPTVVLLKFTRPTLSSYKRKIWNYARADFDKFREILREHDLPTQIQHTDIDTGVQKLRKPFWMLPVNQFQTKP